MEYRNLPDLLMEATEDAAEFITIGDFQRIFRNENADRLLLLLCGSHSFFLNYKP
jgi:hypothetical protein